jgi:hypothetical protein
MSCQPACFKTRNFKLILIKSDINIMPLQVNWNSCFLTFYTIHNNNMAYEKNCKVRETLESLLKCSNQEYAKIIKETKLITKYVNVFNNANQLWAFRMPRCKHTETVRTLTRIWLLHRNDCYYCYTTNCRGFSDQFITLLPTPTVRIWEPSSLDTQSSWTRCFWVSGQVLPHSMIDLRRDCKVLKLGTANKPRKEKKGWQLHETSGSCFSQEITWRILFYFFSIFIHWISFSNDLVTVHFVSLCSINFIL